MAMSARAVIGVKAYNPDYAANKYSMPEWYIKIMSKTGHV